MGLKYIGYHPCPYCQQPARFGIAQLGEGKMSQLRCRGCGVTVSFARDTPLCAKLEQALTGLAVPSDGDAGAEKLQEIRRRWGLD